MNTLLPFLTEFNLPFVFKILLLVLIGVFDIFSVFLFNYILALRHIVIIHGIAGTRLIQLIAIAYLIAAIFLFFVALVIL